MLQNRPIALTLLAAVLLYSGLDAVWGMIAALDAGRLNLNLGILFIPAGIGLLRLSDGWRKFTIFCIGIAALAVVGLITYEIFRPGRLPVTWFGRQMQGVPRYVLFVSILGLGAYLLYWAFRTLTRIEIRSMFHQETPNHETEPHSPSLGGSS